MDKNEIAVLLESLCERPFAGGRDEEPPAGPALPGHVARALSDAAGEQPESRPAEDPAALASILSATATAAQCHGFHEAAVTSGAVRLEAQSALAFVDGIEQAPLEAPADLVEQVLTPAGGATSAVKPGIWSRLAHSRLGGRRGPVVAACAVMLMAGGLSWSLLWRPAELADHAPVPMATSPNAPAPGDASEPKPAPPPTVVRSLELRPDPAASPGPTVSPLSAPPPAVSPPPAPAPMPAATPAPPAQALADPCAPRSFETAARSFVEPKAAKPAPSPPPRTAAVSAPDPGCPVGGGSFEADRNPQADQGPVRAAKPAAKIVRPERDPAAAAASARRAAPAKRPSEFEQRR